MRAGVRDSGGFLAGCVSAGVLGGCVSALWAAVYAGMRGLPLWSPLALYDTHFLGFSPGGIAARSLAAAVVSGVVWQVMLGMATGAFFALLAGTLLSPMTLARAGMVVGAIYGLVLWWVLAATNLRLESPAMSRDLSNWAAAVGFAFMGAVVGGLTRHKARMGSDT